MTTLNINLTTEQFIMMFQQFPKREQRKIVEKISHIANNKPAKLSIAESTALLLKEDSEKDINLMELIEASPSLAFLHDDIEDVYSDKNLKIRY
jgi:hypothetical protein